MHDDVPVLHVPVHQHAPAAVAGVPFGEQVLVPGAEVRGVRGDRGRGAAPQAVVAGGEGGVRDADREGLGHRGGQVAAAHVPHVLLGVRPARGDDRADPGVRPVPVDRQHQALGQHLGLQAPAAGRGGDLVEDPGAQQRLLEDVDQRHRLPPPGDLVLDPAQVPRLRGGVQRGEPDRALAPFADIDPVQAGQCVVEVFEGSGHLAAQRPGEHRRVQRLAQLPVVVHAPGLEVLGQVIVRVAVPAGPDDPDLLAPQHLAQCPERGNLVGHAHRALLAVPVGAVHQKRPVVVDALVPRDGLAERVVGQVPGPAVLLDHLQSRQQRVVAAGGAELKHVEQVDHAFAVVAGV